MVVSAELTQLDTSELQTPFNCRSKGVGVTQRGPHSPAALELRPSGTFWAAPGPGVHTHPARYGGAPSQGHVDRTVCTATSLQGRCHWFTLNICTSIIKKWLAPCVDVTSARSARGSWLVVPAACEGPVVTTRRLTSIGAGGGACVLCRSFCEVTWLLFTSSNS